MLHLLCSLSYTRKSVQVNHKKLKMDKEQLEKLQDSITQQESTYLSLIWNNAIFICAFLFVAFYVLGSIQPT